MAARREGRALDFDALVAFCRQAMAASPGLVLIEGIGGVMVPLDDTRTVLDWIAALNVPTLVVAGSYLGSLSHALTCLDAIARRGLAVKALVVNETANSTVPLADTVETLSRFAASIPIVALPRLAGADADHPAFARLAALL
jgi:dethiobiotin synthetase